MLVTLDSTLMPFKKRHTNVNMINDELSVQNNKDFTDKVIFNDYCMSKFKRNHRDKRKKVWLSTTVLLKDLLMLSQLNCWANIIRV